MGRKGDNAASRRGTLKKEQKGTQVFFREILLCVMRNLPNLPKERSMNSIDYWRLFMDLFVCFGRG